MILSVSRMLTGMSACAGIPRGNWNTGMNTEDMPGKLLESRRVQSIQACTRYFAGDGNGNGQSGRFSNLPPPCQLYLDST